MRNNVAVIRDYFVATLVGGGDHQGEGLSEEHTEVAFATFLLTIFSAINLFIGKRREMKDSKRIIREGEYEET